MTFADHILSFNQSLQLSHSLLPPGIEAMNPFGEPSVKRLTELFYRKYFSDERKRHMIIGINPGRFGGGVHEDQLLGRKKREEGSGNHPLDEVAVAVSDHGKVIDTAKTDARGRVLFKSPAIIKRVFNIEPATMPWIAAPYSLRAGSARCARAARRRARAGRRQRHSSVFPASPRATPSSTG